MFIPRNSDSGLLGWCERQRLSGAQPFSSLINKGSSAVQQISGVKCSRVLGSTEEWGRSSPQSDACEGVRDPHGPTMGGLFTQMAEECLCPPQTPPAPSPLSDRVLRLFKHLDRPVHLKQEGWFHWGGVGGGVGRLLTLTQLQQLRDPEKL